MVAVVECHSGHTYAERPAAFWWEAERLEIQAIAAEWQTPDEKHFRVITTQAQTFELVYNAVEDAWKINPI